MEPAERHRPEPYRCKGCSQPTVCCYQVGDERRPLCPECLGLLQDCPELGSLLLADRPRSAR